jgi:hypothetical protein
MLWFLAFGWFPKSCSELDDGTLMCRIGQDPQGRSFFEFSLTQYLWFSAVLFSVPFVIFLAGYIIKRIVRGFQSQEVK